MGPENILNIESVGPITKRIGTSVAQAMNLAPDYQFILTKKPDRIKALSWFFGNFATKLALKYGNILSTKSGEAGIYTFAPGKNPSLFAAIAAGALSLPKHFGLVGTYRAIVLGAHLEKRRLTLLPQKHWYIIAVGVSPHTQGQGSGHALLKKVIAQADEDGTPIYLEVFEASLLDLYSKLGFSVLHIDHLQGGLTLWCLQRPSQL